MSINTLRAREEYSRYPRVGKENLKSEGKIEEPKLTGENESKCVMRDGNMRWKSMEGKPIIKAPFIAPLYFLPLITENNTPVVGMIDSGAEINVIGSQLVETLGGHTEERSPLRVNGCGGASVISKFIKLVLKLPRHQYIELSAGVSPYFKNLLILGAPFLHATKGYLDYEKHQYITHFGCVPCLFSPLVEGSKEYSQIGLIKMETTGKEPPPKLTEEDTYNLENLIGRAFLNEEQKLEVKKLLLDFGELWIGEPNGRTGILKHQIKIINQKPVREKPRRFAPQQNKIIDEYVQQMLAKQIIRPSMSPHAQEVVLVKKGEGDWRLCVDFRKLNKITVPDEFPLPRIQDLIRNIKDSKYFVALDLRAGYWQILMDNESIPLTAFRAHHALYEYLVMPFGLKTAPATFARLMEVVLGDLYWKGVCVYLDDILIHGVEFDLTLLLLTEVLQRLKDAGLTLAIKKCRLFPKELLYLGYVVGEGNIKPNMKKIEALQRLRNPRNQREVRSLLGCLGYFRQFIFKYSEVAEPLFKLLRKNGKFQWAEEQENAKKTLIHALINVTLANPLETDLLKLETDASNTAISAVLYCRGSNTECWRPVEFLSKNLNEIQRRWPTHEREAYAIVHALQQFDPYLRGRQFEVWTDNMSITWMNSTQGGKLARWASRLAEYDMKLVYRSGKTNLAADFLSRFTDEEPRELFPERASPILIHKVEGKIHNYFTGLDGTHQGRDKGRFLLTIKEIIDRQKVEPPPAGHSYQRRNNIIFHFNKIWVPLSLRNKLIEQIHGITTYHHPGVRRTVGLIKKLYSWSGIQTDTAQYIKSCLACQRIRPGLENLQGIITAHKPGLKPFSRVYMDTFKFTLDDTHYNFLTVIDFYTRWAEVMILSDSRAEQVASLFLKTWIVRFGCPETIITDSEAILSGTVMQGLCEQIGIKLVKTITCHPDGNAPIESFHRVLRKGLQHYGLTMNKSNLSMDEIIQLVLFGYRISYHTSIGETPAYLTFGYDPRPPGAMPLLRIPLKGRERLKILNDIREAVIQNSYLKRIREHTNKQKGRIDTPLEVGEIVLLPIERAEAAVHSFLYKKRKFIPRYTMPYRIIAVLNNGRAAKCQNLVPIGGGRLPKVQEVREVSIQEIRKIGVPLTPRQTEEWTELLNSYLDSFPLEARVRDQLFANFWEEIMDGPLIEKEISKGVRSKRVRNI